MDMFLFLLAKLVGGLIRIDSWLIMALAGIVLSLIFDRRRTALWLSGLTLATLLLLAVFPLGEMLLRPVERGFPSNPPIMQADGIIVLGGAEDVAATLFWGQTQLNEASERYTEALALARRFPNARILISGGSGAVRDAWGAERSEASIAEGFFRAQGIQQSRLLMEDRSRNTIENACMSFELVHPSAGEVWVLVTSAFHMSRAVRSFEAAGWRGLVPYPVDYRTARFSDGIGWNLVHNIQVLDVALKEGAGALAYYLIGR